MKPKKAAPARIPERDFPRMREMVMKAAAAKRTTKPDMAGTSPQRNAYGKAMQSAFKNTKTFGMPGK